MAKAVTWMAITLVTAFVPAGALLAGPVTLVATGPGPRATLLTPTPTPTATLTARVYLSLVQVPKPSMYFRVSVEGHVWLEEPGRGLERVGMYALYGPFPDPPPDVPRMATTGADGHYLLDLVLFNHPEELWVWPELEGYTFQPRRVSWYYPFPYSGPSELRADFIAHPSGAGLLLDPHEPTSCRHMGIDK